MPGREAGDAIAQNRWKETCEKEIKVRLEWKEKYGEEYKTDADSFTMAKKKRAGVPNFSVGRSATEDQENVVPQSPSKVKSNNTRDLQEFVNLVRSYKMLARFLARFLANLLARILARFLEKKLLFSFIWQDSFIGNIVKTFW